MTPCRRRVGSFLSSVLFFDMRTINYIVLHCTATPQTTTVESILRYWREHLRWRNPGYHFLIDRFGNVSILQPIEEIANGVAGYNANSIHISYIGGVNENNIAIDNRTVLQKNAMSFLVSNLASRFSEAKICGHTNLNPQKACPSFDVNNWLKTIGLSNRFLTN